jgi:hypothetical protein
MPFPLISTALGICFVLVWAFIGGMLLRDGYLAARHERDVEIPILPFLSHRNSLPPKPVGGPHSRRSSGRATVRAAS